jgi:hypothetical protein
MKDMRDFRDAKIMARTLRAALATQGLKITVSQSLELIAQSFGVADWNTLNAAIRTQAAPPPRKDASPPPPTGHSDELPRYSAELQSTLQRALAYASERRHEYTTLEHLLLALIDDADAAPVMKACDVDLDTLRANLVTYVDSKLTELVIHDARETRRTAGFQRVAQRAVIQAHGLGRQAVTGAQFLTAMFAERESPAIHFLDEQGMTRYDAVNFIFNGTVKGSGAAAARRPS